MLKEKIQLPNLPPEKYVFEARTETTTDFDIKNKSKLNKTLSEFNKILNIFNIVIVKGCDLSSGTRFQGFALMKTALDLLVSSLHMARQRASVETMALLRIALETGCTAYHVSNSDEAYEKYRNQNYRSTTAISFTKRTIPIVGELWGIFSNISVHTNILGFGPKPWKEESEKLIPGVFLEYGIRKHQSIQDEILLTLISLISAILLKIFESLLMEQSQLHEKWLRIAGTQMEYLCNTDSLISLYDQELQNYVMRKETE